MIQGSGTLAGVDLGSTKTCAVIAEARAGREGDGALTILGVGIAPSEGMKGSAITNLEAATRTVRTALGQAELMAGREVSSVYVGLPTPHVATSRSRGVVAVAGAAVTHVHVKRVQEVGQTISVDPDRELVHALCQEYSIDGRGGIQDPVGMTATRLEADMCIITGESAVCRDLERVVDRSGYRADRFVMSSLATGLAVLTDREREAGVALVEIGGAATDVLVYAGRRLLHAATLPWGGSVVSRDIARGLGVPENEAGRLKHRHGSARRKSVDAREQLEVSGATGGQARRVSRELLAHIIEQRMDEIFALVYEELEEAGVLDRLDAGIVLTGGGSNLPELVDLARSVFNLPVRHGVPGAGIRGSTDAVASPAHATAVGLALFGARQDSPGGLVGAGRAIARVGEWLRDFF